MPLQSAGVAFFIYGKFDYNVLIRVFIYLCFMNSAH